MHGVRIPRGEMTLGVIGSANRDETVFHKPDELDITQSQIDISRLGREFTFAWERLSLV